MKTEFFLFVLFLLGSTSIFSQEVDSLDYDLLKVDINNTSRLKNENDTINIMVIKWQPLDNLLKLKISYLKHDFISKYKNINLCFRTLEEKEYISIIGNVPNCWIINDMNLVGMITYKDYHIFVYNYTKYSLDNYLQKTDGKYCMLKCPNEQPFLINTPSWFYFNKDDVITEIILK